MVLGTSDLEDSEALLQSAGEGTARRHVGIGRLLVAALVCFGLGGVAVSRLPATSRQSKPVGTMHLQRFFDLVAASDGDAESLGTSTPDGDKVSSLPPGPRAPSWLRSVNVAQHSIDIALKAIVLGSRDTCPLTASLPLPSGVPQPSPGCYKMPAMRSEVPLPPTQHISVADPGLGADVSRDYIIRVPDSAREAVATQPAPLMFWMHGQYGSSSEELNGWATVSGYVPCADALGFVSVFPMGTSYNTDSKVTGSVPTTKYKSTDMGTGWNVGTGGNEETCITEDDLEGPLTNIGATEYSCYPSCIKQGKCGRCNWSTCLDDVAFVKAMLAHFSEDLCIDMSRIFLGGQSNGGMLTHYISQSMPGVFAGLNPIYGLPLSTYATGANGQLLAHRAELEETAIVEFHDRQDKTIPIHGGVAPSQKWTWYYASLKEMMSIWASIHSCDTEDTDVTNLIKQVCPLGGNVRCHEHLQCKTQRRVINCAYNGNHGDVPSNEAFGCVSLWFFSQFRRTTLQSPASVQ